MWVCTLQFLRFALVASLLSLAACASRQAMAALPECDSCLTLDSGQFEPFAAQDSSSGTIAVSDRQLTLSGNRWVRTTATYTITATTHLRFWFKSGAAAELQMVGVSSSDTLVNSHYIKLAGTQAWDRNSPYIADGNWQFYDLAVGQWASGSGRHLIFANDNDAEPNNGLAMFGNIELVDVASGSNSAVSGDLILINSGSDTNSEVGGESWLADQFHYGDSHTSLSLSGSAPANSARECLNGYAVPLLNGQYQVDLLFSEDGNQINASGQRQMAVTVEDQEAQTLDIFAAAGGADRPYTLSKTVAVNDGQLDLRFTPIIGCTRINAVRIKTLSLADSELSGFQFGGEMHASSAPLTAHPTFEAIGLYWRPAAGSSANQAQVRYRKVDGGDWQQAHPLWFDDRTTSELYDVPDRAKEYRGSIVGLSPNSSYDVQVYLPATGEFSHQQVQTWNEHPPVAATRTVTSSNTTLTIQESGTADGYLLYEAASGGATIDVNDNQDYNVDIDGSYLIIRGLTLKGARIHGIRLSQTSHHIFIENNDISGWGRIDSDGFGMNYDSGISNGTLGSPGISHIVIQNNEIHHPRSGSNNWRQFRTKYNTDHPLGPQGITLWETGGHNVVRYNRIYSEPGHYFNDGIGGGQNFSYTGGAPGSDSDIYGNQVSHCWDEAIEAEGGNANVRIWNNYTDLAYVHYGMSSTTVGPLYLFRNVAYRAQRSDIAGDNAGVSIKAKGTVINGRLFANGKVYLYHNTFYRTGFRVGTLNGIYYSGGVLSNMTSRNNIFDHEGWAIKDGENPTNDFDYDLYQAPVVTAAGQEEHGINQPPLVAGDNGEQPWGLSEDSPAIDQGEVIPNFNDDYRGHAPDMGAAEYPLE